MVILQFVEVNKIQNQNKNFKILKCCTRGIIIFKYTITNSIRHKNLNQTYHTKIQLNSTGLVEENKRKIFPVFDKTSTLFLFHQYSHTSLFIPSPRF